MLEKENPAEWQGFKCPGDQTKAVATSLHNRRSSADFADSGDFVPVFGKTEKRHLTVGSSCASVVHQFDRSCAFSPDERSALATAVS
jgi:hypothetical protein